MIDFELTEEQRALIDMARRFTKERIIPVAAECDRDARFPREVFQDAWKLGLVNPTLPTEYGGAGLSDVDSSLITEELAYGCTGIQTSITANTLALTPIKLGGTPAQKKKYLGWLSSEPIFASYATTEPSAGSDVAGLQTRAVKDSAGGYVLNGSKCWITNQPTMTMNAMITVILIATMMLLTLALSDTPTTSNADSAMQIRKAGKLNSAVTGLPSAPRTATPSFITA